MQAAAPLAPICVPLALVLAAVRVRLSTLALSLIGDPLARVHVATRVGVRAAAVTCSVDHVTFVGASHRERELAVAVGHVV